MKKIKTRMTIKSIKRINKHARLLKRTISERSRRTRYKEHENTGSSFEQIQDRNQTNMQEAVNSAVRVSKGAVVTIGKRWRHRYRVRQSHQHVDLGLRPITHIKLRRGVTKGLQPQIARRKRRSSSVKVIDRQKSRTQPAGKTKWFTHAGAKTTIDNNGKTKGNTPRRKNTSSAASPFSGMKMKGNVRQRRTLKVVSRTLKSSRSFGRDGGQNQREDKRSSSQQQRALQTAVQLRRSIQWSRTAAQMNLRMIKMLVRAVVLLIKGLSTLLGISSTVIILLCIVMIIAALVSSPFGIFVADENTEPGTQKLALIVEEVDVQFSTQLEHVRQAAGDIDRVEISYVGSADNTRIDNWPDVLAVFAVKTSTNTAGFDVVTMDRQRVELLQAVFWDMNQIDSHIETLEHTKIVSVEQDDGSIEEQPMTEYERILQLSIIARTAEQQAAHYNFSNEQINLVEELLSAEFRPMMFALLGKDESVGLSSEQLEVIRTDLPAGVLGSQAVELALTRLGDPYSQPKAGQANYTDCSYLVQWVYRQLDVTLPRTAAEQARFIMENGLTLNSNELIPGDLIFWSYEQNGRFMDITHVGIYAGNGKVVDASSSRLQVVYRNVFDANLQVLYGRPYFQS
ncbi:putative endopeptidase precursor [Paenibacillus konkukensis]|uniref:Endopeptidase n=1 Tax=Paenibacillus konkukensis TaxID=2020716 RepID=A0ABY4RXQ6_9BACL|nr:C40 family peptidase [Paenibacillus konkukensis]UQZ86456.1 putative endopeptidase precursor [Paenibacillus konkukensis]